MPTTELASFPENKADLYDLHIPQQVARGWQLGSGSSSSSCSVDSGEGGGGVGSGLQHVVRGWQLGSGSSGSGRSLAGGNGGNGFGGGQGLKDFSSLGSSLASELHSRALHTV
eukprot:4833906-Karenia_brevis.AAC.1